MTSKVFIDGEAGTTGLLIRERLSARSDIDLLSIDPELRKNQRERRTRLNEADVVVLCLPDSAAREAVGLIENPRTRILDASTAHRVSAGWTYGFPEMAPAQRQAIVSAPRVSNPGCYATGFIALMRPLVKAGLVPTGWPVSVNAISGYSGGGRPMIAEFEGEREPGYTRSRVRTYALSLSHKHMPEMQCYAGLEHAPLFAPSVGRFRQGMLVETPLPLHALPGAPSIDTVRAILAEAYIDEDFIEVADAAATAGLETLDPELLNGSNQMKLFAFGRAGQGRLIAILDNLGKGASGAAVQNLNLMIGAEESTGL